MFVRTGRAIRRATESLAAEGPTRTLFKIWSQYIDPGLVQPSLAAVNYWRYRRAGEPIIFIAALPKSGTTWLENMARDVPGYVSLRPPGFRRRLVQSWYGDLSDEAVWDLPEGTSRYLRHRRGVMRMHSRPNSSNLEEVRRIGAPVTVMYRDPRDIAVSWFFFVKNKNLRNPFRRAVQDLSPAQGVSLFIEEQLPYFRDWIRGWRWALREGDMEIRYEALRSDPAGVFQSFLKTYGIHLPDARIASIVEEHSFDRPNARRAHRRKGVVGDWRTYFDEPQKDEFKAVAGDLLVELDYESDHSW